MREIKFRCWYINQMYKVNSIDFSNELINLNGADIIDFKEGILMQYTGLKDKNGVEIYENDVIQVFNTIGEVSEKLKIVWDKNMGTYEVLTLNDYHYSYDTKCAIVGCEIIGNIYDKEVE